MTHPCASFIRVTWLIPIYVMPQSYASFICFHFFKYRMCVTVWCGVLRCVAVCCSVLQCVAVCCGALQCVAVRKWLRVVATSEGFIVATSEGFISHVAVCCGVLRCVAVCCGHTWMHHIASLQHTATATHCKILQHTTTVWMRHDTLMNASYCKSEWVMSYIWMSHVTHIFTSHVTRVNESYHTHECITLHV